MSRRKRFHHKHLPELVQDYTDSRNLDYNRYSEYHLRVIDQEFTCVDIWTTAKYWIKETNYHLQGEYTEETPVERGGEQGFLPVDRDKLFDYLDRIFYATELPMEQ